MRLNPSRRALVGGGIAAMATLTATNGTSAAADVRGSQHPDRSRALSRGIAAYAALERHLASKDGSGLVHERYPATSGDNAYSYEWPFSQVHVAALDLAAVDSATRRR